MALRDPQRASLRPVTEAPALTGVESPVVEPVESPIRLVQRPALVVSAPDPAATAPEEFLFSQGTVASPIRSGSLSPVRVAKIFVALVALAVLAVVVHNFTASKPAPAPPVSKASSRVAAAAPAPVAAPPAVGGVEMSVIASTLTTNANTYKASVTIRNPTDLAATQVTVNVTLNDASGHAIRTETRSLELLPKGGTADLTFSGELGPGEQAPAGVKVTAVAAGLVS